MQGLGVCVDECVGRDRMGGVFDLECLRMGAGGFGDEDYGAVEAEGFELQSVSVWIFCVDRS